MSDASDPKAAQPSLLKVQLFNHQLTSLHEMEMMEQPDVPSDHIVNDNSTYTVKSRLAIMGDIPGYGKSYTMVALILNDKMPCPPHYTNVFTEFSECRLTVRTIETLHETINCSLLLVGPSLVGQWKEYFADTPLRVKTVINNKHIEDLDVDQFDVVIVIPSMFNNLVKNPKYSNKFWKRFVYDEPTSVHVASMEFVNACFYWLMTASYNDLLDGYFGRSGMLRKIFYKTRPHHFTVVKNSKKYLEQSFKMPEVISIKHVCYTAKVAQVLKGFVSTDTANLISAGDITGAISALGAENFSGNIVEYVSSKFTDQITMYTAKLSAIEKKVIKSDRDAVKIASYKQHIESNTRQRNILQERFETMLKDNDCPICCDKLNEPIMVPCCQNIFCGQCLLTWLKDHSQCPYCRGSFEMKDLVHIKSESAPAAVQASSSALQATKPKFLSKPDTVVEIIKKTIDKPEARIIIYSMSDQTFHVLTKFLDEHEIVYGILKGCSSTREKVLASYHNGSIKILLLNSNYNGAGINLQETTDIIVYHDMCQSVLEQVIGRAMRVGRMVGNLNVHYLTETHENEYIPDVAALPAGSSAQHAAGPDMDDMVAIESAMAHMGYSEEEIAAYRASQMH